jgi:hypothetical protein
MRVCALLLCGGVASADARTRVQAREAWSKPRQAVVITACGLLQPGEQ